MINGMETMFLNILNVGIKDQVYAMKAVNGRFIYEFVNDAVLEKTDITRTCIGMSVEQVLPSTQASFLIGKYREVLDEKDIVEYADSYSANSKTNYSNTTLTPIIDKQGNVQLIVAVVQDVTKQKEAEQELHQIWNELNKNKKWYQSLFKDNPDAIISFDLEGKIINGNPQVKDVTGYHSVELIGKSINMLLDQQSNEKFDNLILKSHSEQLDSIEIKVKHCSNALIPVTVKITPLILDDKVEGFYAIFHDMTKEKESEKKLQESEERFRIIAENAHDLIVLLNHQGRIIYASPSFKRIVGFSQDEYLDKIFLHNIHPEDQESLHELVTGSIKEGKPFSVQNRHYTNQQSYIWVEANGTPVFDEQGNFKHMVVLARDITIQKEYEEKLEHGAMYDYLTDLPNRRLFTQKLKESLDSLKDNMLAVLMLDLDDFKNINDTYGHDVGDKVIVEFGNRIQQLLSKQDIIARLGGDEFIIMLPNIQSINYAVELSTKIKKAMAEEWVIETNHFYMTTSIGISRIDSKQLNKDASLLLKQADIALYEAKRNGKNGFYVYQESQS
ncbi:PAS domain S-box protein [Gracilibacillus sp. D59]|uniref:sensor domain-containing protein n=1 Tax=Gracilibacillus sp. D59 TaxID=3457434 RepID=UPI003FCE3E46